MYSYGVTLTILSKPNLKIRFDPSKRCINISFLTLKTGGNCLTWKYHKETFIFHLSISLEGSLENKSHKYKWTNENYLPVQCLTSYCIIGVCYVFQKRLSDTNCYKSNQLKITFRNYFWKVNPPKHPKNLGRYLVNPIKWRN